MSPALSWPLREIVGTIQGKTFRGGKPLHAAEAQGNRLHDLALLGCMLSTSRERFYR